MKSLIAKRVTIASKAVVVIVAGAGTVAHLVD